MVGRCGTFCSIDSFSVVTSCSIGWDGGCGFGDCSTPLSMLSFSISDENTSVVESEENDWCSLKIRGREVEYLQELDSVEL